MAPRLTAGLLALVVLATGALPVVGGYRCLMSGARMDAPSPCCRHEPDHATLKGACCAAFAAPRVEPRRTSPSSELRTPAPVVIATIAYPDLAPVRSLADPTAARARGRPPGEELHLRSTILRV